MPVEMRPFGFTGDGTPVELHVLTNRRGASVAISTYGARVVSLRVPDRAGRVGDVVLGYDDLAGYLADRAYFGALVGRCANRIAGGWFALGGRTHQLDRNDGPNHLHGGARGFDRAVWAGAAFETSGGPGLDLRLVSPDGDMGYPGTLRVAARYTFTDAGALGLVLDAETDAPTLCALTHHGAFDLDGAGDVLGHRLGVNASRFTAVGEGLVPTGALPDVEGTPFDFRAPRALGARIHDDHPQLALAGGYDHNFVLDRGGAGDEALVLAARLEGPASGRVLEVLTTEPGLQVYSGNFLDGVRGRGGARYAKHAGICLEPQRFPDAPHHPGFPSVVLRPGERYRSRSVFRLSVAEPAGGAPA